MALITYQNAPPDASTFADYRKECGWGKISETLAKTAISNSLIFISAYNKEHLVGFGRVIGDGALNYYIQDLIVEKAWQSQGIGKAILTKLLAEVDKQAVTGATVGLMAASGKEQFYELCGFTKRPNAKHKHGAGMTLIVGWAARV